MLGLQCPRARWKSVTGVSFLSCSKSRHLKLLQQGNSGLHALFTTLCGWTSTSLQPQPEHNKRRLEDHGVPAVRVFFYNSPLGLQKFVAQVRIVEAMSGPVLRA